MFGIAFIAVMILSLVMLKRFQVRGMGPAGANRRMKVLERMVVGRDTVLQIIQVGERQLLISVGRDGARLICELSPGELPAAVKTAAAGTSADPGFGTRFWHNMKVNTGLLPKGTPYMTVKREEPGARGADSFDAALRQATEKTRSPISEQKQRSGHRRAEGPARQAPSAVRQAPSKPPSARTYQNSIDQMTKLSEPDALDRRTKANAAPDRLPRTFAPPAPEPPPAAPPQPQPDKPAQRPPLPVMRRPDKPAQNAQNEASRGERGERIDDLLDRIAERQSRYQKEKDKDKT